MLRPSSATPRNGGKLRRYRPSALRGDPPLSSRAAGGAQSGAPQGASHVSSKPSDACARHGRWPRTSRGSRVLQRTMQVRGWSTAPASLSLYFDIVPIGQIYPGTDRIYPLLW